MPKDFSYPQDKNASVNSEVFFLFTLPCKESVFVCKLSDPKNVLSHTIGLQGAHYLSLSLGKSMRSSRNPPTPREVPVGKAGKVFFISR